jgi:hypothetical protein
VGSNPTPSARLIFNDLRREVHPYRNASRNASALFPLSFLLGLFCKIGRAAAPQFVGSNSAVPTIFQLMHLMWVAYIRGDMPVLERCW